MTDLPEGASPPLHEVGRLIGRFSFLPFYRVRVHGVERIPRTGAVVLIANHSSMVEPQLIFGMLPRRSAFLVKQELFVGPLGWFFRRIGQIPVRRGAPDRAPLRTAVELLRRGGMIGVFPEGSRGAGDVSSAERGAAWLVRASGAVVLPVATRGTLPARGRSRFRPVIDVLVGEPFVANVGAGATGLTEATEQLRRQLAELVRTLDDWRASARGIEKSNYDRG